MKTVQAHVYGKEFTLACDTGQEAHLAELVRQINARCERLTKAVGKLPDNLMLLYTALMVADELHDAQKELVRLRAELATSQKAAANPGGDEKLVALEETLATNLEAFTSRIEALSNKLAN